MAIKGVLVIFLLLGASPTIGERRCDNGAHAQAVANQCHNQAMPAVLHWNEEDNSLDATEWFGAAVQEYCKHLPELLRCTEDHLRQLDAGCNDETVNRIVKSVSLGMGFCKGNTSSEIIETVKTALVGEQWNYPYERMGDCPRFPLDVENCHHDIPALLQEEGPVNVLIWMIQTHTLKKSEANCILDVYEKVIQNYKDQCNIVSGWKKKFLYDLFRHFLPAPLGYTVDCDLLEKVSGEDLCRRPDPKTDELQEDKSDSETQQLPK